MGLVSRSIAAVVCICADCTVRCVIGDACLWAPRPARGRQVRSAKLRYRQEFKISQGGSITVKCTPGLHRTMHRIGLRRTRTYANGERYALNLSTHPSIPYTYSTSIHHSIHLYNMCWLLILRQINDSWSEYTHRCRYAGSGYATYTAWCPLYLLQQPPRHLYTCNCPSSWAHIVQCSQGEARHRSGWVAFKWEGTNRLTCHT